MVTMRNTAHAHANVQALYIGMCMCTAIPWIMMCQVASRGLNHLIHLKAGGLYLGGLGDASAPLHLQVLLQQLQLLQQSNSSWSAATAQEVLSDAVETLFEGAIAFTCMLPADPPSAIYFDDSWLSARSLLPWSSAQLEIAVT
jgi:hypothetical protein